MEAVQEAVSAERGKSDRESAADRAAVFDQHRRLLFSIAYRMLGSVMDAEDMVQEAFLRWQRRGGAETEVLSPKAYLSAIVTRLCIDYLRSARVQREQYVGPWLPEPLMGEQTGDPAESLALADSLSMAFLLLLERLAPRERAVFLLREVFEYDYPEVARIVGTTEANCRQIARRARQHLAAERPRFSPPAEQLEDLTQQFGRAVAQGDVDGLLTLLADDVTVYSDGGGKAVAARRPVRGAALVVRFLTGLMRNAPPGVAIEALTVNGRPGLLTTIDGAPGNVVALDMEDGRIHAIYIVVNPDKLRHLSRSRP